MKKILLVLWLLATSSLFALDLDKSSSIATYKSLTGGDGIQLEPSKSYTFYHRGTNESGVTDTNDIYLAVGAVAAGAGDGKGKVTLTSKMVIVIGPGVSAIQVKASAGSPCITISTETK